MTDTAISAGPRRTVSFPELLPLLIKTSPDIGTLATGTMGLLRKPTAVESIGYMFQRGAAKYPERPFIVFKGKRKSYGEVNVQVNKYAHALEAMGVGKGDVVGILCPNSVETLELALAVVKLGAVAGMLNYNQREEALAHSINILEGKVLVVASKCQEAVDSLPTPPAITMISVPRLTADAESQPGENPPITATLKASVPAFLIYTSGTTGLPKASVMTHFRWLKSMSGLGNMGVRLKKTDVIYCCLPLYHNNALTVGLSSAISSGAAIAVGEHFSASRFWDNVAQDGATAFMYIGELCRYLLNQPPKASDAHNNVRIIVGNGMRAELWGEFVNRFKIERVAEFYGASECNIAFINALGIDRTAGVCPLPHAVVAYDEEEAAPRRGPGGRLMRVGVGEVGILLTKITKRAPFDGYTDKRANDDKLVANGFKDGDLWFNTGDLVRKQGWMHLAFVDRLGDTFRWKGENVATTEVEGAMIAFPGVEHAVVYGVKVPGTDGRAGMAAITLDEGVEFDGEALAEFLCEKLPAYAVPLFIRIVDDLEQTSTFKAVKVELRKRGYEADRVYVLPSREQGYVPWYENFPHEVAGGASR
jgi:fatty-acyl-CoA synthase